jgi:hypothetical protein
MRSGLLAIALVSAAGCKTLTGGGTVDCPPGERAGREIHVKAPAQKVVVVDSPDGAPCSPEATSAAANSATANPAPAARGQAAGTPHQPGRAAGLMGAPAMAMGGVPAGMGGVAGAPSLASNIAAIPTIRGRQMLSLGFDIVRIPVPVPRLFTHEGPPELQMAYMQVNPAQMGGAAFAGAAAFPGAMMAPGMAGAGTAPSNNAAQIEELIRRLEEAKRGDATAAKNAASDDEKKKLEAQLARKDAEVKTLTDALERLEKSVDAALEQKAKYTPSSDKPKAAVKPGT